MDEEIVFNTADEELCYLKGKRKVLELMMGEKKQEVARIHSDIHRMTMHIAQVESRKKYGAWEGRYSSEP